MKIEVDNQELHAILQLNLNVLNDKVRQFKEDISKDTIASLVGQIYRIYEIAKLIK